MCLICTDLIKNKLTIKEAQRNIGEMVDEVGTEHVFEILRLIDEKREHEDET